MTNGSRYRAYHMRWTPDEWLKVATLALGFLEDHGYTKADEALDAAQRAVLPSHRWRESKDIRKQAGDNGVWHDYMGRVMAMTHEERLAILAREVKSPEPKHAEVIDETPPPPAPEPVAEAKIYKRRTKAERALHPPGDRSGGEYCYTPREILDMVPQDAGGHVVRWTRKEWALLARGVKWVEANRSDLPRTWQKLLYAQTFVLDRDRQRPAASISQSAIDSKRRKAIDEPLALGMSDEWTIKHIPFNPPGSEAQAETTAEPPVEPVTVAPEAAPAMPLPPIPAPVAIPAPPAQLSTLAEAAKAFGETIMGALDQLLATHSRLMMEQVNARLTASAQEVGTQVAALIETSLRKTVHTIVETELGGPVAAPHAPAPNVPPSTAGGVNIDAVHSHQLPRTARRLKVDIVGVNEKILAEIKERMPADIDARLVHGNQIHSYTPSRDRQCILITERIPHAMFNKIKREKIDPIYTKPTAGHVMHAVEELQRAAMQ